MNKQFSPKYAIKVTFLLMVTLFLTACGGGDGSTEGGSQSSTGGSGATVKFDWEPNSGTVNGYVIYFGFSSGSANTFVKNISTADASFNPVAPSVSLSNLGVSSGDTVCFKLKAYNDAGFSDFTNTVCKVV